MQTKRIVCLANSRKYQGICIAGKEWIESPDKPWVRPISAYARGELDLSSCEYVDGARVRMLDVFDVRVNGHVSHGYQTENWSIAEGDWVRLGSIGWSDASALVDNPHSLWADGSSTARNLNDQIPVDDASRLNSSLTMIHVGSVRLNVFNYFGNRKLQAQFEYRDTTYRLWVTDSDYEETYKKLSDGSYDLGESLLTVSLAEPFNNHVSKLVAGIVERAQVQT